MSSYQDFRPRNPRRGPTYGLGSGYHAVDKARYSSPPRIRYDPVTHEVPVISIRTIVS